ncbi:Hypothetical protein A7982_10384 [Minicystis rosea]|nr:Hypothetical protein A7982_10384 [Minicystis rosea]
MRKAVWLAFSSVLSVGAFGVHASGCVTVADDCTLTASCQEYADVVPVDAPPDPACDIPPMLASGAPKVGCGVYAAPAAVSGGDGSRAAPFTSLQAAIDAAEKANRPVYACAKEFAESISVPSGVTIYGGLDCDAEWQWTAGKHTLVRPVAGAAAGGSEIAARLRGGTKHTVLSDIDITAPDGVLAGVSSIALLVEDTAAEITRATLTAGDGKDGDAGSHLDDDPVLDGMPGNPGYGICAGGATNPAPETAAKACGAQTSTGGKGGDGGLPTGSVLDGGEGGDGQPQMSSNPNAGQGGVGQSSLSCGVGGSGADGDEGASGKGAIGLGALSKDGYRGGDGAPGDDGKPGQGGGGGGAAKGKTLVQCTGAPTINRAGATGGGGGTGGCGGARGGGGRAGGSSLTVVSLSTRDVMLTDVALNIGAGGRGGNGGAGQNGGSGGFGVNGGPGANGTASGCSGGNGGNGGKGGAGGGGQGGHSIGIAYTSLAPKGMPNLAFKGGMPSPGAGGAAGPNGTALSGAGAAGTSGGVVQIAGP